MVALGRRAVWAALVAVSLLGARPGQAHELGLANGQAYSLWTNINASLLEFALVVSEERDWQERLAAMAAKDFSGMRLANVLDQVERYRSKLERLRDLAELSPIPQIPRDGGGIGPSDVYLASSEVLHAQVELLIRFSGPEQLVSQFYRRHDTRDKTPSQLFSLVEVANRRLEHVLLRAGVPHDRAE